MITQVKDLPITDAQKCHFSLSFISRQEILISKMQVNEWERVCALVHHTSLS